MIDHGEPLKAEARREDASRAAYESVMGVEFLPEAAVERSRSYGFKTRVIPAEYPVGLRDGLRGKRVAVVGNGAVEGLGEDIDSHEEVIRISAMRDWRKDPKEDGCKATLWAGQLAFVAADGMVDPKFRQLVEEGVPIWALSPYHVTCDAYNFLRGRPARPDVTILPSAETMFGTFGSYMSADDLGTLTAIAPPRKDISGLTQYDLLLTGTRLVLALEAVGVGSISLFGFDLFTRQKRLPWVGHDVAVDLMVLRRTSDRFRSSGREFRWITEPCLGPRC
jgi:hypothetical protein